MNKDLQRFMSQFYRQSIQPKNSDRGFSSYDGTQYLRDNIIKLFEKHSIQSVFDAGCNDCGWANVLAQYVDYHGGDIAPGLIAEAWANWPDLDIQIHDITTDPIPNVDAVLMRDVTIHLSHSDKHKVIKNWISSGVPWILMTHCLDHSENIMFDEYTTQFPVYQINWSIEPWNFPQPVDCANEMPGGNGRVLGLWHRDQIINIL